MNRIILAIILLLSQKETFYNLTDYKGTSNVKVFEYIPNNEVYKFEPKKDITPYELAKIITILYGGDIKKLIKEIPEIERHFVKIK